MQFHQLKRREFITLIAWPSFGVTYYNLTGHKILFVPSAIGGTCDQCAAYNSHTLSGDVRHSRQSTSAEFTAGIGGAADVLAAEFNRRKSALRLEMPGAFPSLQRR